MSWHQAEWNPEDSVIAAKKEAWRGELLGLENNIPVLRSVPECGIFFLIPICNPNSSVQHPSVQAPPCPMPVVVAQLYVVSESS